ncbi:MAG: 4-hydroxythreonine-4-phosphate dehydrogenase PdxA [Bacteroidetes bacterium]|nr:4-hydroxythreonine-4-phosphate dehydrogenase PdxA [Bacteroidota bacterium]
MEYEKIKVGITQGDINGISYEVIIKTLEDNRISEMCTPILYGSPKVAAYHRKAINIPKFSFNHINSPEDANLKRPNIINVLDDSVRVEFGKSTSEAGQASFISMNRAVSDLREEKIDVLVTAPINKNNIRSDDFNFPGHTEYLESFYEEKKALMIMVSDLLRVGIVTGHIPVAKIPEHITMDSVLDKLILLEQSLIQDFGVHKPTIAVLGLNPHAGDEGVLGSEEIEIITPAIEAAKEEKILAFGPYPADGFFGSDKYSKFDAVLAMYHDQGLAPFKALVFESGVNFTAGLPIIRTSPAHGTAYELAGQGVASPDSFRNALYLACDIYRNRKTYAEITSNPLESNNNNN